MKERKIYWCRKCDKIHRKTSKDGKAHFADYVKQTFPEQSFLSSKEMKP